jgi:hypothetical protein
LATSFSIKPSYMTLTFVGALIVSAGGGLVTELLLSHEASASTLAEKLDLRVQGELETRGWVRLTGPLPERLEAERHVVIMTAPARFSLSLAHGPVEGRAPSAAQVQAALAVMGRELRRYPPGFFAANRFARVLLCAELSERGKPIPSLPNFERSLIIEASADPAYFARLLHHEIFHFVDYSADDRLDVDPEWEALNDAGFSYGNGGRQMRAPAAGALDLELPGFVTPYATSALAEDKAEVFAFMMTESGRLKARGASDRVLSAKVALLRRRVRARHPGFEPTLWAPGS